MDRAGCARGRIVLEAAAARERGADTACTHHIILVLDVFVIGWLAFMYMAGSRLFRNKHCNRAGGVNLLGNLVFYIAV